MSAKTPGPAAELFQGLVARYDINQAALARSLRLNPRTLSYYLTKYPGRFIPNTKQWSDKLRGELLARGATPEEAAELFGLQHREDIKGLQNLVVQLVERVGQMESAIDRLTEEIRTIRPVN